jgi:hypothetical protein
MCVYVHLCTNFSSDTAAPIDRIIYKEVGVLVIVMMKVAVVVVVVVVVVMAAAQRQHK